MFTRGYHWAQGFSCFAFLATLFGVDCGMTKTDSVNLLSNATLKWNSWPWPSTNCKCQDISGYYALRNNHEVWLCFWDVGSYIMQYLFNSRPVKWLNTQEYPTHPDAILPDCHPMACIPAKDTRTPSDLALLHQNSCSWNMIPERLLPCLRKSVPCAVHLGSVVYHWIFCHFGGPCACCASSILALIFTRLCTNAKVETLRWSNYRVLGFSRTPGYLLESAYKSSWCFFDV